MPMLTDKYGRAITDLRISVTDRCNYKCVYCRTGNFGAQFADLPMADYLRMARVFVSLGITKIRITGGEPLLRNGVVEFVGELSKLQTTTPPLPSKSTPARMGHPEASARMGGPDDGKLDLAITTNGHLLAEMAQPLADAGLRRVTISVDAMEPEKFSRITRVPGSYEAVMAGVQAAKAAGLSPIKVNCVLLRGFNDDQIVAFGKFARDEGVVVRFIEFMPLEEDRVWSPEIVVTLKEILAKMNAYMPLREIEREPSETARRFVFEDGVGEIGIIAPVSEPFCGHCSRVRITSDGKIRTCLFSIVEHDLYGLMRGGASDDDMREFITSVVNQKEERHHIGEPDFMPASRTMVHIGG